MTCRVQAELNKGEVRNAFARAVFMPCMGNINLNGDYAWRNNFKLSTGKY